MFVDRKAQLLADVRSYIAECSRLDPPPVDYIADLDKCRAWAETSNEDEWPEVEDWWNRIRGLGRDSSLLW